MSKTIDIINEILDHYVPDGNPWVWKQKIMDIKSRVVAEERELEEASYEEQKRNCLYRASCTDCDIKSECLLHKLGVE